MASYALAIGAVAVASFFIYKKITTLPNPPKVTDIKKSCISIASPGGFEQLCHTDAPYGVIGANVAGVKPGILSQHLSKMNENIQKNLVMVQVHAFGLNYADCAIRWGLYSSAKKFVGWPITPGFEFSGKVIWCGSDNTKFKIGDVVFGVTMFGAYATEIALPSHQLFHKPDSISMSQAASMLVPAFTAYHALFNLALPTAVPHITDHIHKHTLEYAKEYENNANPKLEESPKKHVLVHSASGGVGSMLVQLCKKTANIGCVIGVVGGKHKIANAKKLGCDIVIDRKSSNLKNGNIWDEIKHVTDKVFEGFDVVFDANGVATLKQSYKNLIQTGTVVVYGFHTMLPHSGSISPFQWIKLGLNAVRTPSFDPMKLCNENKSVNGFNLSFLFKRTDILQTSMSNLLPWIDKGIIKPGKVTEYKMENVGDAHRDIQTGKTIGKLVMLTPFHDNYKNA